MSRALRAAFECASSYQLALLSCLGILFDRRSARHWPRTGMRLYLRCRQQAGRSLAHGKLRQAVENSDSSGRHRPNDVGRPARSEGRTLQRKYCKCARRSLRHGRMARDHSKLARDRCSRGAISLYECARTNARRNQQSSLRSHPRSKSTARRSNNSCIKRVASVKAQLKCPLSSSIKMTTLISHSLY